MTYLDHLYEKHGSRLGVQPLEIIAGNASGKYIFPAGNALLRDNRLLAVTAKFVGSSTFYTPLENVILPDSVTNNAYLTLKCSSTDIINQFPFSTLQEMVENGIVMPIDINGLTLDQCSIEVANAATTMSGQTGKSFLLSFYGLFY